MEQMPTLVFVSVCLLVTTSGCQAQRPRDQQPLLGITTKELADSLQEFLEQGVLDQGVLDQGVLEQDGSLGRSLEKKASVIPRCDLGERCALKHGPRIGRLCDCLRGAACNTFFLRCY